MTDIPPKLIYLTRRNPAFARDEWTARWRQHGALGMSRERWKNVQRYVHCDLIEPQQDESAFLGDHDGVGLIWHRSIAHRNAHFADNEAQAVMEADERETFAEKISLHCLSVEEQVVVSPDPDAIFHLFCFAWDDGPLPKPASCRGQVDSKPLPHPSGGRWSLDCTRITESWFENRALAVDAARKLAGPERICVIGRDCELYRSPGV
ncbi:EthD domain-containing protein [Pacificimonas sp. ICDLI1SI03]